MMWHVGAPFIMDNQNNDANKIIKVKQGDVVALSVLGVDTNSPKSITVYEANYGNQFDIYKRDGNVVYFTVSLNAPLGLNSIVFYDNDSTSSDGLIFHNAIEVIKGNSVTPTTQTNKFPSSITVNGITTNLNYGYIFSPKSTSDLFDYSTNNNIQSLIRRSPSDNYPEWVQDNGMWGLDFHNSLYSALQIDDSENVELNSEFTVVFLIKKTSTDYGCLAFKWHNWITNDLSYAFYSHKDLYAGDRISGEFNPANLSYWFGQNSFDYMSDITYDIDPFVISYSSSTITRETRIIKNQTTTTPLYGHMPFSVSGVYNNSSNLFLGNTPDFDFYDPWDKANLRPFKGVIFGFAIIKQVLSEDQIKELHRQMGF